MTARPSEQQHRGAYERLELLGAATDPTRTEGFGSFEHDLSTGESSYSAGLRQILGVPDGKALTHKRFLSRVHAEDRALVAAALERAVRDQEPVRLEVRVKR